MCHFQQGVVSWWWWWSVVTVPLPGDDLGVEDGVGEQSEEAEGQPPPVEEALPEDEEHGGGLEQHEAAQPRHRGVEAPG